MPQSLLPQQQAQQHRSVQFLLVFGRSISIADLDAETSPEITLTADYGTISKELPDDLAVIS